MTSSSINRYRVLVTDYVWPTLEPEQAVLGAVGAELVVSPTGDEATLARLAGDVDAILTCFARVTARVVEASPRLRIVARYGIGVDNIDVAAATRRGVVVTNVPAYCVDEVSDHALALLLAGARAIVRFDRAVRAGRWDTQAGQPLLRIRGRTLGIVGFGKIGQSLAGKARALGLGILAHDPYMPADVVTQLGARPVDLETLLRESDFISLHAPATRETERLIGERELGLMKPTAFLVNTARGSLIDVDALARALRERRILGAGLDVLPAEPPPADSPLRGLENVILTPHSAFYSAESLVELQTKAASEVARVLRGERPLAVINPEVYGRDPGGDG